MKNDIVTFIGEPGSGKSTMMNYLNGYIKISSAQILLNEGYNLSNGELIDDKIVVNLLLKEINKINSNIILDGFPRTVMQLKELVYNNIYIDKVYKVCTPYDVILDRIKKRLTCINCHESFTIDGFKKPIFDGICDYCGGKLIKRDDDNIEIFKKRLEIYKNCIIPLVEEYKKLSIPIIEIDGLSDSSVFFQNNKEKEKRLIKKI